MEMKKASEKFLNKPIEAPQNEEMKEAEEEDQKEPEPIVKRQIVLDTGVFIRKTDVMTFLNPGEKPEEVEFITTKDVIAEIKDQST